MWQVVLTEERRRLNVGASCSSISGTAADVEDSTTPTGFTSNQQRAAAAAGDVMQTEQQRSASAAGYKVRYATVAPVSGSLDQSVRLPTVQQKTFKVDILRLGTFDDPVCSSLRVKDFQFWSGQVTGQNVRPGSSSELHMLAPCTFVVNVTSRRG